MKTNFYINRKSSGLIAVLMVLSSALSFADAVSNGFDQNRYNAILKLYLDGNLNKTSIDAQYDIQVVRQHRDALDAKLAAEKTKVAALYAPGVFKVAGKGLAAIALAGGLSSAIGAIGAWGLLASPKNKGLGYFEFLRYMYSNLLFNDSSSWSYDVKARGDKARYFISWLTGNEQNLIGVGFAAPSMALGSLALAGISKYLLNKASSYTGEIERLQAKIERDNEIIMALKAI